MKSNSVFLLLLVLIVLYLRSHCLAISHKDLFLFSWNRFIVLALTFKSFIHFELIFYVWYDVGVQHCSFLHGFPVVPTSFAEMIFLSSPNFFGAHVKISLPEVYWITAALPILFHRSLDVSTKPS